MAYGTRLLTAGGFVGWRELPQVSSSRPKQLIVRWCQATRERAGGRILEWKRDASSWYYCGARVIVRTRRIRQARSDWDRGEGKTSTMEGARTTGSGKTGRNKGNDKFLMENKSGEGRGRGARPGLNETDTSAGHNRRKDNLSTLGVST